MLHSIANSRVSNLDEDKPSVGLSPSGDPQISGGGGGGLPSWDAGPTPSAASTWNPPPAEEPATQAIRVPVPSRQTAGMAHLSRCIWLHRIYKTRSHSESGEPPNWFWEPLMYSPWGS